MTSDNPVDPLDIALERLRAKVDAGGMGPLLNELSDQLGSHYRAVAASIAAERIQLARLNDLISDLVDAPPLSRANVSPQSRIPGGRFVHRVIGKLTSRQLEGVYQQIRARDDLYRTALVELIDATIDLLKGQNPTIDRRVATLADRVSLLEERAALRESH